MKKTNTTIRSPFFYVGDKYKLMPQLKQLMPKNIERYIEQFVGGGSSFLNFKGSTYVLNDVDTYVVELHRKIGEYAEHKEDIFAELFGLIDYYRLSCSYRGICVPDELKKKYVKTYYSRYNKGTYICMRDDFNSNKDELCEYLDELNRKGVKFGITNLNNSQRKNKP